MPVDPDFGLFVFDVVSDILNGVNFINDGDPVYGGVIIGIIFLPCSCLAGYHAIELIFDGEKSCWMRLFYLLLLPLLFPIFVALATPAHSFCQKHSS